MSDEESESASSFELEHDEADNSTSPSQASIEQSPGTELQRLPQAPNESTTKKRPAPFYRQTVSAKRRRLRGQYNDSYRKLLNDTIHEAADPFANVLANKFTKSHFGGSFWTSKEKDIFFEALSRYGRDDLARISAAIGTKSVIEVKDYLLTLRED